MPSSCRLYLITPSEFELPKLLKAFEEACSGGDIACLQIRMKEAPREEIVKAALAFKPLCQERGIALIINDYPDIAAEVGADGVHIGEDKDGGYANARKIVGADKVVGVSCYGSRHRAMEMAEEEADYVAFGAFYPTQTKEPKARPEPEILEIWSQTTEIPCVAIGGITPENAGPLVKAGADFIAVVTGVWNHPAGPRAAVKAYNDAILANS